MFYNQVSILTQVLILSQRVTKAVIFTKILFYIHTTESSKWILHFSTFEFYTKKMCFRLFCTAELILLLRGKILG